MKSTLRFFAFAQLIVLCTNCRSVDEKPIGSSRATSEDVVRLAKKYNLPVQSNNASPNGRSAQELNISISKDSLEMFMAKLGQIQAQNKPLEEQSIAFMNQVKGKRPREIFDALEKYPLVKQKFIEGAGGQQKFEAQKKAAIEYDEKK